MAGFIENLLDKIAEKTAEKLAEYLINQYKEEDSKKDKEDDKTPEKPKSPITGNKWQYYPDNNIALMYGCLINPYTDDGNIIEQNK